MRVHIRCQLSANMNYVRTQRDAISTNTKTQKREHTKCKREEGSQKCSEGEAVYNVYFLSGLNTTG